MKAIRLLSASEIELLEESYQENKEHLESKPGSEISWMHLYLDGKHLIEHQHSKQFEAWVKNILKEVFAEDMPFVTYGFLMNPKQSGSNQEYHIDYDQQMHTVFVTMAFHVSQNSTQYVSSKIRIEATEGPYGFTRYGTSDKELLERSGADFIEVTQLICKPYLLLHQQNGTIHRGIANRTSEDRPLFWINCSKKHLKIKVHDPNQKVRHTMQCESQKQIEK